MNAHFSKGFKIYFFVLFAFLTYSCGKGDSTSVSAGFSESFSKTSGKIVEFDSNSESPLYLSGSVKVDSGRVEVIVITPSNVTIYDRVVSTSKTQVINSEFGTLYGTWILKYKSIEGSGNIDLKLHN